MRQKLLLLLLLLAAWGARAQTLLQSQSFENGETVNYTSNSFLQDNRTLANGNTNPGTGHVQRINQYFQRATQPDAAGSSNNTLPFGSNTAGTGFTSTPVWPLNPTSGGALAGSYFWAAEATQGSSGTAATSRDPGFVKLNSLSVTGKTNLQVRVALLDPRYTGAVGGSMFTIYDTVQVQVRLNGAGAWRVIGRFLSDQSYGASGSTNIGPMRLDANGNSVIDAGELSGPVLTATLTDFTFNVGVQGSTMETRVVVSTSQITREIGFDNIRVYGTAATGQPPVLTLDAGALPYSEGQAATAIVPGATVADSDSPTLSSGSARITSGNDPAEDVLAFVGDGTTGNIVAGTYDASTGTLPLTSAGSTATLAQWQSALRKVTYRNTDLVNATAGNRVVTFTVTDPTSLSDVDTRTIAVTTALGVAGTPTYTDDFTTDGEGDRYASNTYSAANGSAWLRTSINPYSPTLGTPTTFGNISNNSYWYGSVTNNSSNPSTPRLGVLTTKQVNTTGFVNLQFSIRLGASSTGGTAAGNSATPSNWLTTEYFKLYYRTSGSSTWTAFGSFRGTTSTIGTASNLRQDTNPAATSGVPGGTAELSPALTTYTFALPSSLNGQTLDFQLVLKSDDAANDFAFDLLQVSGTPQTTVNSIVRASANPTNAATVNYTVTFGTAVTGLTANNFTLTTSGISGAAVGTPVAGTGTTWTVPVTTGTGSGTLTLNLANDTGLSASITTTLPFAGETYTIDKTVPTATIALQNPASATTNATAVTFRVTFSEAVTGVGTGSFTLNTGGTSGTIASATSVSGSTTVYDVVVNSVSGNGTLGISLKSSGSGVTDLAGNAPATGVTGPNYTIDQTAPTATIGRQNPTTTATNATSVTFRVTFSEAVSGVGIGSFLLVATSTATGTIASVAPVSTSVYDVTVSSVSGNGQLSIILKSSNSGVTDAAGNAATGVAGPAYTIDQTAPTVTALTSTAGTSGSTTTTTPFPFTVTFSEAVSGFSTSGITVSNGTVASAPSGTSPGTSFTFTVTPITAGTVTNVTIATNAAQDAAGNGSTASSTYALTYQASTAAPTLAVAGNVVNGQPTFSGSAPAGSAIVITILQGSTTVRTITGVTATSGGTYSYTVPFASLLPIGSYTATATAQSGGSSVSVASGQVSFTVPTTGPTTAISSTAPNPTSVSPIPVTVTFKRNVFNFGASGVTVGNSGGTATVSNFTAISGKVYTFSVVPSASGLVTVNVPANAAQDSLNRPNQAAPSFSIQYNQPGTAAPVITAPTNNTSTNQAVTVSGSAPAGSAVMLYFTQNGSTQSAAVTATATGTFSLGPLTLQDGSYTVYATAQSSGASVSGNSQTITFTVDTTRPTVTSLTSTTGTSGSTTATTPFAFSVSFSESVTGFSTSGISVTNGTVVAGSLSGSGSGPYSFTVMPTTAGTATTVTIAANAAQDAAGNGTTVSSAYTLTYVLPITSTTWTGTSSPDWFTAGNWTAGVPTATIDATISASAPFQPVFLAGTATTRSLTLNSGSTLTQGGGTLDVRGNLTNNGTYLPTGGTVILGTTFQSNGPNIFGSSRVRFWNLTVNVNGVQLSTSAGASVRRLLTLNGAFVTQGNPFVLESDASGTALVVNVNSAGFVFGAATVQRYIDASGNTGTTGYRHYASPVGGATVSSLSTSAYGGGFTAQVNPAYNTANPNLLTLATYPNVFGYDESKIAASPAAQFSDFDKGYQSPASLGDPLTVGRGYAVQIGNSEKVQLTGPLNNNAQTIGGLTYAAAGTSGAGSAGWALVGNPYPAPLDWGTVTTSQLTGVDAAAYVFQSLSAYSGRYTSFTNGVGAGTGRMASGQGFFVHASTPGTTGSIALTNANRVTTYASPNFQRQAETRPLLRLSLALGNQPATVATAQDETFVYFETGATDGFDGKFDAYKLANPSGYYLGSVTPGSSPVGLSIDARSPLAAATLTEIPLWVSLPAGSYSLTATELLNFASLAGGTQVQLRDALLGTLTDLATTPSHSFTVAANAPYAGRFSLVFRTSSALAALPGTELALAEASLYPNPAASATVLSVTGLPAAVASVQVELLDVLGRAVASYSLPAHAGSASQRVATNQLAGSLYLLRLTALDARSQVLGHLPTQRLTLTH